MSLIRKPNEIQPKKAISVLIYGQPGMGKTTLACSASNPVLFDFDGGVNRINSAHQVPTLQVEDWTQVGEALQEVLADPSYESIIVDTVGKMVKFIEAYIKKTDLTANKGKRVWVKDDGTLSLKGFGVRKNIFCDFVSSVMTSGRSVYFVGHEKEEKRGDIVVKRVDAGSDGYAGDIFKDLDLVGYVYGVGNERHITFKSNDEHFCKKTGSMEDDYKIPVVVDAKGNAVGQNNFFAEKIIKTYSDDQKKSLDMHKEYDKLIDDIDKRVSSISSAEDANLFVSYVGGTNHIYDSKIVARNLLLKKVAELKLTFDNKAKTYVAG